MKKIALLIFLIIISCKKDFQFSERNKIENIEINFPELSNWKECYSNEAVKNRFDELLIGHDLTTLGVYLNNELESVKDSIDSFDLDDYAVFLDQEKYRKWKIKSEDLKSIYETQKRKKNITSKSADLVVEKVLTDSTFLPSKNLIELEEFKSSKNVHAAVMLVKPYSDDHQYIVVIIYNLINVQNHLIYGSYNLRFNGIESIELAKRNSKKIMSEFVKLNEK